MVKFLGVPIQPFAFGVTVTVAIRGIKPLFVTVKEAIFPIPADDKPMDGVSFVHSKVVPTILPVNAIVLLISPLHLTRFNIVVTVGVVLTVTTTGFIKVQPLVFNALI